MKRFPQVFTSEFAASRSVVVMYALAFLLNSAVTKSPSGAWVRFAVQWIRSCRLSRVLPLVGSLLVFGLFSNVGQAGMVPGLVPAFGFDEHEAGWLELAWNDWGSAECAESHDPKTPNPEADDSPRAGVGEGCGTSSPAPTGGGNSCSPTAAVDYGARAEAQAASGWVRVAQLLWNSNPVPQDLLDPPKA